MRTKLVTCMIAAAVVLGACGDDSDSDATADGGGQETTTSAGGELPSDALVQTGETTLGEVLTDAEGFTLYGFTNDTDGVPTCDDGCAETWPAATVESAELPAGLDPGVFSVVDRSDGTFQLAAGTWPLYRFAGDEAAGDTNGQGSGGVWFVVTPDGQLQQGDAAPPPETTTQAPESAPVTEADSGYGY